MRILLRFAGWLLSRIYSLETLSLAHYWMGRFGRAGSRISIGAGFKAYRPDLMEVGSDVSIAHQVTLRALTSYPWSSPAQSFEPRLTIDDGCFIGNGSHVSCARRITIGKNVMIADHCYLADSNHDYRNIHLSIKAQPLLAGGELSIGDDTWIGANCCISGAFRIGRHCVIGANSVVTSDVPDFSVAAGAPARVIKQFDHAQNKWVRFNS